MRTWKKKIKKIPSERKQLERELDSLWHKAILDKYNHKCFICGKTDSLHAAHLVSCKHKVTRWDLNNGLALCVRHHLFYAHREPIMFFFELEKELGRQYLVDLVDRARKISHFSLDDLREIEISLQEALAGI